MTNPREISAEDLHIIFWDKKKDLLLIDVRDSHEFEGESIKNSINLPLKKLEQEKLPSFVDAKQSIVVYCLSGQRSRKAAQILIEQGCEKVYSLKSGLLSWKENQFPVMQSDVLSDSQQHRYQKQLILKEVGLSGQKALLNSKVLIIGMGGLGCPVATYLNCAGIGSLGLVDGDTVCLSNLQRQFLYSESQVGVSKVTSAIEVLSKTNSETKFVSHSVYVNSENIFNIIKNYDIVINAVDNFKTRYLINEACVALKVPLVDGAISNFEGMVMVFDQKDNSPCYSCVFPNAPKQNLNCNELGVLGVLPGIVGVIQATEAIKLVLKKDVIKNQLLVYNALNQSIRKVFISKNPDCSVCNGGN